MSKSIHERIKSVFGAIYKNPINKMLEKEGPDYDEILKRWNHKIDTLEKKKRKKYCNKNTVDLD